MSDIVQILQRGYELIWHEDRLEDALGGLDPAFEWNVPGALDAEPRRGPEATIAFFRDWAEPFDDLEVEWEVIDVGSERALVVSHMRGRGRGSGVPTEMHFAQLWSFDGSRAMRMDFYTDVDAGRAAAGL